LPCLTESSQSRLLCLRSLRRYAWTSLDAPPRRTTPSAAAPAGRLYQVEYAITAVQNAAAAVGIQCAEGIVVACEKRVSSKLLAPSKTSEKTYKLDEHVRARPSPRGRSDEEGEAKAAAPACCTRRR
jgi:hypothetical protein